jgi:hypothetical protein
LLINIWLGDYPYSNVAVFGYYNGRWDIFAAKVSFIQWVRYLPVVESGK